MAKIKDQKKSGSARLSAPNHTPDKPSQLTHPVFCFRHLQCGHDVEDCQPEDQQNLIKRLRMLSKMEWTQIEQAPRHGLGKENIAKTSINPALPTVITDDVKLWALRFSGPKPMVGFRSGPVFHVVWLDHNFSVYPH